MFKIKNVVIGFAFLSASAAQMQAAGGGGVCTVFSACQVGQQFIPAPGPVVPYMALFQSALPILNPLEQAAIGLPTCYPNCAQLPARPTQPLGGIVTPSGGKGVKLAGPVQPPKATFNFQVVSAPGQLPVAIQMSAGTVQIKTQLITVPNGLLLAPAPGAIQGGAHLFPGAPTTVVPTAPVAAVPVVKAAGKGVKAPKAVTPAVTPVAANAPVAVVKGGKGIGGGPGYAVPGEVIPPSSATGKDNNAQAEKHLNAKEVDEIQTEAMEKDNQGKEMESPGHDMNQDMDRSLEAGHGMDGVRDQDKGAGSSGDNRGSTGSGSDGGVSNSGGGTNSGSGSNGGHGGGHGGR